jgi:hypothetical protein
LTCIKIDEDPRDPEGLEDLRHLTFKESEGTRAMHSAKSDDKMFANGMIFPIDKAECISPIVIQTKKCTEDIRVCVD